MQPSPSFDCVAHAATWSPRYGHACVAWQDRLWLLGGTETCDAGRQCNDVWSSADGLDWTRVTGAAPWAPRWGHAVFAIGGAMVLIGGLDSVSPIHNCADIWITHDGADWTLISERAPWTPRHVWATATTEQAIWLIGGATDGQLYHNDVWRATDGRTWSDAEAQVPRFAPRKCHAAAALGETLWVAGGSVRDADAPHGARYVNDVWRSADGSNWQLVKAHAPWRPRCFHHLLACHSALWLVGGNFGGAVYSDEIWRSTDGAHWQQAGHFPWEPRHAETMTIFRDRVWVMGGTSTSRGTSAHNDVWTWSLI